MKNQDKLTKREKLNVIYVAVYVIVIVSVVVYAMLNPDIMETTNSLIEKVTSAFSLFAN